MSPQQLPPEIIYLILTHFFYDHWYVSDKDRYEATKLRLVSKEFNFAVRRLAFTQLKVDHVLLAEASKSIFGRAWTTRLLLEKSRHFDSKTTIPGRRSRSPLLILLGRTLNRMKDLLDEQEDPHKHTTRSDVRTRLCRTAASILGPKYTVLWLLFECDSGCADRTQKTDLESCRDCAALIKNLGYYGFGLQMAALHNDLDNLRLLMHKDVDVDACNIYFRPALHVALTEHHREVALLLLDHDASAVLHPRCEEAWSALHKAVMLGDEEMVAALVRRPEVDINGQDGVDDCATALHLAVRERSVSIARILLEAGADVHMRAGAGDTALHVAAIEGQTAMIQLLWEEGAALRDVADDKTTAFEQAAGKGHLAVVRQLVELEGINIKYDFITLSAALKMAASDGHLDVVRQLVEYGANMRGYDSGGVTPLHAAAHHGHGSTVRYLLEAGADLELMDYQARSPLLLAVAHGQTSIVETLLAHGAKVNTSAGFPTDTLIAHAIRTGNITTVKLLLQHGADPNLPGPEGRTALIQAAADGSEAIVRLLLKAGADVTHQHGDYGTALHWSAYKGYPGVMRALIAYGADVNAEGGQYPTALMATAPGRNGMAARLLLEHGADVHAIVDDDTALQMAVDMGSASVLRALLQYGAGGAGHEEALVDALDRARRFDHQGLAQMLLRHANGVGGSDCRYAEILEVARSGDFEKVAEFLEDNRADFESP